ncbi:MAG: epoxyalkane--coenzyme M transferase, partial [Candidatus Eiseniibacteriota bacterium]
MKLSTDRILTTHVGSLPRPQAVVELLFKKERGEPYDAAAFERAMTQAVADVVKRQRAVGIDVVSDGEMSKIGYATYIQDRLSGFGGHTDRKIALDLVDYPDLRKKMAAISGTQGFNRASCIAPIEIKDRKPLAEDIAHFKKALAGSGAVEGFMNSASPGLVTAFQPNQYYKTHEQYVGAVADAMKEEYEAIVDAGFVLQLDCPDLAMARHTG